MRGYGGGRVIRSLLSYPCRLSAKAIISTLPEKIKQEHENEVYKVYIAECARIITENTAKSVGGNYIKATFADILKPQKEKIEDTRTGEEIAFDVLNRIGIEVR